MNRMYKSLVTGIVFAALFFLPVTFNQVSAGHGGHGGGHGGGHHGGHGGGHHAGHGGKMHAGGGHHHSGHHRGGHHGKWNGFKNYGFYGYGWPGFYGGYLGNDYGIGNYYTYPQGVYDDDYILPYSQYYYDNGDGGMYYQIR